MSIARDTWTLALSGRVLAAMLLGIVLAGAAINLAFAETERDDRESVVLTGTQTDVQFLAGRSVTIKANVSDDVFAVGRDVKFDAATVHNAVVAGYDVELRGGTAKDFVAAAGNLRIAGRIADVLVALARSIRIAPEGVIGGDVRIAAETIVMEGQTAGSMRAAARRITISGRITGKADLLAQRIVIASGAEIAGDLIYRGKEKPEIADGAKIGGQVRQIPIDLPDLRSIGWAIVGISLLIGLAWLLASVLLVVILHWVFPNLLSDAVRQLREQPWSSLGRGVAIGLIASAVAGALMVSIIGIPLGGALFMGIGVAWLMGLATVCACVGLGIRQWRAKHVDEQPAGLIWWATLGAVILGLVALVPVLGWIVTGLAAAAGLGAAAGELWHRLRHA